MSQKKCQCGATPRYHVVRGDLRGRRRYRPLRERLECPACGNRTAAMHSRELLCEEWETAGWCGQAEVRGAGTEAGSQRTEVTA